MLTVRNMTKTYGGRTLFEDVDMTINWGERLALVGPNGAGKSTLIKIILGQEEADRGKSDIDEYAIYGYLAQEAGTPDDDTTILDIAIGINAEMEDAIKTIKRCEREGKHDDPAYGPAQDVFNANNGYQLEPKAKKILTGLGFKQEDIDKPAKDFSGGWNMRAHLSKLLCLEPDLLILDEPTNHLDLMALLWFQKYLQNYPGAIFMISHDRDFMDAIVENVVEIDDQKLIEYTGNYSEYLVQREERFEQRMAAYRNQRKEIERIQEFIDRFRSVGSKASQVQSRIKQIEKMDKLPKPIAPRKVFKFSFPQPDRSNQKVIELDKVDQAYGDKVIYTGLDLTVERGDCIALVGPNGAGKSTLLKILADVVPINGGTRDAGYATKIGYYSQHRTETMDESNTVLDEVMSTAGADLREEDARSILGQFLFRREDVQKRVRVLSGGEKSRLNLVKFLVNPPNLLLMDEPTTHLDIMSIEALVSALKTFEGTLVFVSHDVHFIRSLAETTIHITHGKVTKYSGGYDYYLEKSGLLDDERGAITAV